MFEEFVSFIDDLKRNSGVITQPIKLKIPKAYQPLELYKLFFSTKMAPPIYTDLGKLARDLFKVGYHPGIWQLDCKTMTSSGIEFFTNGFASQDASKVVGSLQSKYKLDDYGLTLTERWNTDNLLFGQIAQKDKVAEGLLLALEGSFHPSSGDKTGKFWLDYVQDAFNLFGQIGIKGGDPSLGCSLVMSHNEFLGGVALDYDINGENLSWRVALGWAAEATVLHGEFINGQSWLASLFYKLNEQTDTALEVSGGGEEGELQVGLGCIYRLEEEALIRAKINLNVELGLGYQQKLREGVTVSASTIIDCQNISDGNHKFGVGLSLSC